MVKLKNKNRILTLILIILMIFGNFTEVCAEETFGLDGPEDLEFGCINTYNNLLYVSGVVTGIDPALLKTIMCRETGGKPSISLNDNGTFDAGIMQINDVSSQGYSAKDRNSNHALNVWLATEVIRGKSNTVKGFVNRNELGETVKSDVFSILWLYNGYSKAGMNYAYEVNNDYILNTELSKTTRGHSTSSSYKSVDADTAVQPKSIMFTSNYASFLVELEESYEEYTGIAYEDEDFSDMTVPIATRSGFFGGMSGSLVNFFNGENKRDAYNENLVESDYSTEVTGQSEYNQKLDYASYKITRAVIKAIFTIISILVYGLIIFMVMTWVLYLFYFLGVFQVNKIMKKITRGKLDCTDEDIVKELLIVTAFVAISTALIITGFLQSIVTHFTLWIMTIT